MLLVVQFETISRNIKFGDDDHIPSWEEFNHGVVKSFKGLKGRPYSVKNEHGITLDEYGPIFEEVVKKITKFVIHQDPIKPTKHHHFLHHHNSEQKVGDSMKPLWTALGAGVGAVATVSVAPVAFVGHTAKAPLVAQKAE